MYAVTDLFDLTQLPPELGTFLHGHAASPTGALDALNTFHSLLTPYHGQGIVNPDEATIQPGAVLLGDVILRAGAVIKAGAVLDGLKAPVFVGEGVEVGSHATLRNGAYLAAGCVVGHGADIKNTLALPGAKIQDGTFAGDSILGRGARVGSGAILSNRKFNQSSIKIDLGHGVTDSKRTFLGAIIGDQARLGANVTLSPGSVIGAYTWVGSGCVIHGSIPPGQLVTVKQELSIRPKPRTELDA